MIVRDEQENLPHFFHLHNVSLSTIGLKPARFRLRRTRPSLADEAEAGKLVARSAAIRIGPGEAQAGKLAEAGDFRSIALSEESGDVRLGAAAAEKKMQGFVPADGDKPSHHVAVLLWPVVGCEGQEEAVDRLAVPSVERDALPQETGHADQSIQRPANAVRKRDAIPKTGGAQLLSSQDGLNDWFFGFVRKMSQRYGTVDQFCNHGGLAAMFQSHKDGFRWKGVAVHLVAQRADADPQELGGALTVLVALGKRGEDGGLFRLLDRCVQVGCPRPRGCSHLGRQIIGVDHGPLDDDDEPLDTVS